jgi:tetratricopeptide (TPR) repeat protein
MFRKVLLPCCLLFFWTVGGVTAEAPWLEVRSPNFIVVSNAGEREGQRVAGQFERIRTVFQKAFRIRVDPGKPVIILAVRDEKALKELLPAYWEQKDRRHPAGVFQAGQEKHYVAMRVDVSGDQPYHIVYHEYVHMLVNLNFRAIPIWLNEGVAELYGNSVILDKEVGVGRPSESSLRLLQQNRLIPLQTLVAVDRSSPYYNEREKTSLFYAESWALTHYLVFVDKNQKLKVLFEELNKDTPAAEAAARALGDLKQLERTLEEYVRRSVYTYTKIQMPTGLDERQYHGRVLSPAESTAVRADFLVHTRRPQEARPLLEKALGLDPNLAIACESMGLLHLYGKERSKAVEWFEKAAKLDSRSYLAHYYYGANLLYAGGLDGATEKTAEGALKKAIELNAGFAPAYSALGSVYSRSRERMPEALAMAMQAIKLEPADVTYRLNAGRILVNLGRFAEARKLGEGLLAAALDSRERTMTERFLEDAAQRWAFDKERQQLEKQIADIKRQQAEQQKAAPASTAPASPAGGALPRESVAPPPTQEEIGTRAANAVVAAGTVGRVQCMPSDDMVVTLETGKRSLVLHSFSFREIQFSSKTWQPPDPFLPCSQLQGLQVQIKYYPLSGTRYAGEISAIEITEGR